MGRYVDAAPHRGPRPRDGVLADLPPACAAGVPVGRHAVARARPLPHLRRPAVGQLLDRTGEFRERTQQRLRRHRPAARRGARTRVRQRARPRGAPQDQPRARPLADRGRGLPLRAGGDARASDALGRALRLATGEATERRAAFLYYRELGPAHGRHRLARGSYDEVAAFARRLRGGAVRAHRGRHADSRRRPASCSSPGSRGRSPR